MWFKNLYLYQLQQEFPLTAETLHERLSSKPFAPCTKEQREASGWVAPLGKDSENLAHGSGGFILISMAHQERILPSTVIRETLEERVEDIEARENRKLGSREKKDLREQIEFELLPQAFTRTRQLDAWIDTEKRWVVLNTSSASQAERLTSLLRKTIDSFPVITPDTQQSPTFVMTQWLSSGVLPAPFELGEECELRSQGETQAVASFKKHELLRDEVKTNLASGKFVSKLMLTWDKRISFVLTDALYIKRVKFLDVYDEQLEEQDPQSQAERRDIEFTLMTGEVARLIEDLMQCFNSAKTTT